MLRRISLLISMIALVGSLAAIAGAAQKEKSKAKDQAETKEQKEKTKTLYDSPQGWLELASGDGGYLGVYLEEVTPERTKDLGLKEERGAIVMKVVADSPAEKSGLKENDVIVSFNGRRVDSVRELQRLLNETPADRSVQIEIIRSGSRQTLATTLTKRSFHGFGRPDELFFKDRAKGVEELFKGQAEAFKQQEEAMKRYRQGVEPFRDFGDFTFVNPGEFWLFGGSRLGISAESLTDQLAEFFGVKDSKGALVASVSENSAAARAGIKAGDVIIAIDNEKVDSVRTLLKAISAKKQGTIAVKVVRNRSEQTINVTIEEREPVTPRRRAVSTVRPARIV